MSGFKDKDDNAAAALYRRIKKGVTETVNRPVPGIIRMNQQSSSTNSNSNNVNNNHSNSNSSNNNSGSEKIRNQDIMVGTSMKNGASSDHNDDRIIPPYIIAKYESILKAENVDLKALRKISWNGVPFDYRPVVWQLLLGYLPTNRDRREPTLERKRKEYLDSIPLYYDVKESDRSPQETGVIVQILKDLPRTNPNNPFFHQNRIQKAMERIMYIWSIRHPASGYVQGMDDLLSPLLLVSIQPYVKDPLKCDVALLDEVIMSRVEADAYWCMTKLLDNIQDHYTFSQPGLQRMILRLEDLVHRIDNDLHNHFVQEGVGYMQFSFRWMNCALMRDLPLKAIMRLWDTYFAEEQGGFENFHVYVCVVLLKTFKDQLMKMDFQNILTFLQNLPTSDWGEGEVELILSQAFILSTLFEDAPNHLN